MPTTASRRDHPPRTADTTGRTTMGLLKGLLKGAVLGKIIQKLTGSGQPRR
jgi:hypothetical protein